MSRRKDEEEALRALENTDWSGAVVDSEPRSAKIVHSARIPAELSERLEAEASRRGITPSALICEFVRAGLSEIDESAMVRLADVHRLLDSLAHRAA
jgi:predicted DNA-binding protein